MKLTKKKPNAKLVSAEPSYAEQLAAVQRRKSAAENQIAAGAQALLKSNAELVAVGEEAAEEASRLFDLSTAAYGAAGVALSQAHQVNDALNSGSEAPTE